MSISSPPNPELDAHFERLHAAIRKGCTDGTCHRHWSRFVRERDGHRCVVCDAGGRVAAHHVFRKSLLREARFQTGNGATLCRDCHREAHGGFNGAADMSQPIDAEGGEKLERVAELYRILAHEARRLHPGRDDYYDLSEQVIAKFMIMQGFDLARPIVGTPIDRAWYIWDCSPPTIVEALIRANMPSLGGGGKKRT